MRIHIMLAAVLLSSLPCLAGDFTNRYTMLTTLDGGAYSNARPQRISGQNVVLIHSKGIAYVEISSLPDAVRADLGLPTTADVARQETEERRQIEEKKRFEAAQRAKGLVEYYDEWITPAEKEKREKEAEESRKEALRASIKTIKEVETDQSAFLDKRLVIGGRIDVDNYYNWKYGDAQDTHYSFRVSDGTGLAHLYADRVFGKILRDDILKAGSALRGSFSIRIESERYDEDSGEIMARIVSWGPPAD